MPLNDVHDVYLNDFGVSCTAGGTTAKGILDMPSTTVIDGEVLSTEFTLRAKSADFGSLLYGAAITVDGVDYSVLDNQLLTDGAFTHITLSKLVPGTQAPGATPNEFSLNDLTDVQIRDLKAGDRLVYDGDKWVDQQGDDGTNVLDGGGA